MARYVHNIQTAGHADWAGKRDVLNGEGLGVTSEAIFNCLHQTSVHSIPLFMERQLFVYQSCLLLQTHSPSSDNSVLSRTFILNYRCLYILVPAQQSVD